MWPFDASSDDIVLIGSVKEEVLHECPLCLEDKPDVRVLPHIETQVTLTLSLFFFFCFVLNLI